MKSVKQDDAEQGLADKVFDVCDMLFSWGHVRQKEIKPEIGKKIVERIMAGRLGFVALHSAQWSTPFVEAMYERTRRKVERQFPSASLLPGVACSLDAPLVVPIIGGGS